ncbi:uncharacterized protein LOC126816389 [Patella vulgata]|uniref:uncharacterized protein LOC126816389 n=1 Tax=Patella vulgata TaxID=6465 RepID=UPI0024A9E753|nr:uncharacterized protein LOC126816389 [Patella vulgata]
MASSRNYSDLELGPSIIRPDMEWEPISYTMPDILETFPPPRVVRCDPNFFQVPTENINFDVSQPFLLYQPRKIVKYVGDNMKYDSSKNKYLPVGNPLLIPKDYKGWFALLGSPQELSTDVNVPVYITVKSLVKNRVIQFLIGGNRSVQSLQMQQNPNLPPDYRTLYPGDVLRIGGTYVAKTTFTKKRFFKNKVFTREERFVKCTDENDRELLIPISAEGEFYAISSISQDIITPIDKLESITQFPMIAKLVHGRMPATPCSFTGTILISSYFEEHSVISSTVFNVRNIMLEIPVDTILHYNVAKNQPCLLENKSYKDALALCIEKSNIYMRQIKVSFLVTDKSEPSSASSTPPDTPAPPVPRLKKTQSEHKHEFHPPFIRKISQLELHQKVPIISTPSIRLTFGNNSLNFSTMKDGSVKLNKAILRQRLFSERTDKSNLVYENVDDFAFEFPKDGTLEQGDRSDDTNENVIYENVTFLRKQLTTDDSTGETPPPLPPTRISLIATDANETAPRSCRSHIRDYEIPVLIKESNDDLPNIRDYEIPVSINESNDDLPLGSTCATYIESIKRSTIPDDCVSNTDSGYAQDTESVKSTPVTISLNLMSVDDVSNVLKGLGFKANSIAKMKSNKVDGSLLASLDPENLSDTFPELNKLEVRKLALYLDGSWLPKKP